VIYGNFVRGIMIKEGESEEGKEAKRCRPPSPRLRRLEGTGLLRQGYGG